MTKSLRPTAVPPGMRQLYEAVVALTDTFCRDRLNAKYRDLVRAMAAALCRKRPHSAGLRATRHLGVRDHPGLELGASTASSPAIERLLAGLRDMQQLQLARFRADRLVVSRKGTR